MAEAKTLLPEASVHFFVKDSSTLKICRSLEDDWRFARIDFTILEGGVEEAITHYESNRSGDLVVIETDNIDESFTSKLDGLANVCMAGTGAIFIGPTNDVTLYRQLIEMGVSDYLVRPVDREDLVAVITKGLTDKIGTSSSKMISVIGAKGGVGTTTIAQLFSWGLTEKIGEKAVLMDCAGGWSVAPLTYHVDPVITLREASDVAAKDKADAMTDLLHQVTPNLSYLAVGGDPLLSTTINGDGFESIVDRLMEQHPTVVVDLSSAPLPVRARAMARSHTIIVVSTPLLPSLRNTRILIEQLREMRDGDVPVELVINHSNLAPGIEVSKKDIIEAMEFSPAAIIPHDPKTFTLSEAEEKPVYEFKDAHDIIESLLPLVSKVSGKSIAPQKETAGGSFLSTLFGQK